RRRGARPRGAVDLDRSVGGRHRAAATGAADGRSNSQERDVRLRSRRPRRRARGRRTAPARAPCEGRVAPPGRLHPSLPRRFRRRGPLPSADGRVMGGFRFAPGRPPAVACDGMIATSHVVATQAGLRMFELGGNAVDAALAAAAALCVVEPMSTGLGGDAFALVWRDRELSALDAAGPAPASAEPGVAPDDHGPRSVTVPGAVAGWSQLAERHGRLGLDRCLAPAIDLAERGVALAPRAALAWVADAPCPAEVGPRSPRVGERIAFPL